MSKKYLNYGYLPVNPYQCPTNFFKAPPCPSCADKPVCQQTFDLALLTGPVVGFKHESWVTDDCVDVGDGVVKFRCGPVDLSDDNTTEVDLKKAIVAELRGHELKDCAKKTRDVTHKILSCNIILNCVDGKLIHEGKQLFTAFVLEDGTEVPFTDKKCSQVDVCTYEQFLETGVSAADIESELASAGIEGTVEVIVGAIPADGDLPAQDKVIIKATGGKTEVTAGGKKFNFCGCKCEYVADEAAAEEDEDGEEAEEMQILMAKTKAELLEDAKDLDVKETDTKGVIAHAIIKAAKEA